MAKLSLTQTSKAYVTASLASVSTGLASSYILSKFGYTPDYSLIVAGTWLVTCGVPSLLVSGNTLRRTLGEKQTTTVTAGTLARKIPVNNGLSHVFMSVLPIRDNGYSQADYGLANSFTVDLDNNTYTVTNSQLEDFLRVAWRRQLAGLNGLSRPYWTKQRRPRLKTLEYQTRLCVLSSVNGLIIDRSKRRSGKLALPPKLTLNVLQSNF